ncbi:MAG TPA: hypothetical protein VLV81_13610 [Acidimicrobiia bacterium]|nr:hypothetical protein [Acidimicrobiia bacterium]
MSRRLEQTVAATHGALVEGERVVAYGFCWAAQLRRVPLLFLGRRRYVIVLTNRRLLLFPRRGRHLPRPTDLVLGKRYEWFTVGKVRRARPMMQVLVTTGNDARMVFEFPPSRRALGRTLLGQLGEGAAPAPVPAPDGEPAPTARPDQAPADVTDRGADDVFWGPSTQSS